MDAERTKILEDEKIKILDEKTKIKDDEETKILDDKTMKIFEDNKKMKIFEDGEKTKILKDDEKMKVLEDDKKIKMLEDDEKIKILEDEKIKILEDDEKMRILEDAKSKILEDDKKIKILGNDEKIKMLEEEKPKILDDERVKIFEDGKNKILENGERIKIVKDDGEIQIFEEEKIRMVEDNETTKILEDEDKTKRPEDEKMKIMEDDEITRILEDDEKIKILEDTKMKILKDDEKMQIFEDEKIKILEDVETTKVLEGDEKTKILDDEKVKLFEKNSKDTQVDWTNDTIFITHYVSPQVFWFVWLKELQMNGCKVIDIEKELPSHCGHDQQLPSYAKGQFVIVKYEPRHAQTYLRGKVRDCVDDKYLVYAMDYGFMINSLDKYLWPLPKDLQDTCVDIKLGSLADIMPKNSNHWTQSAISLFDKLLEQAVQLVFRETHRSNNHVFGQLLLKMSADENESMVDACTYLLEQNFGTATVTYGTLMQASVTNSLNMIGLDTGEVNEINNVGSKRSMNIMDLMVKATKLTKANQLPKAKQSQPPKPSTVSSRNANMTETKPTNSYNPLNFHNTAGKVGHSNAKKTKDPLFYNGYHRLGAITRGLTRPSAQPQKLDTLLQHRMMPQIPSTVRRLSKISSRLERSVDTALCSSSSKKDGQHSPDNTMNEQLNSKLPPQRLGGAGVRNILAQWKSLQAKEVAKQANSSNNSKDSPDDIVEQQLQSGTCDMVTQQLSPTKPSETAGARNILTQLKSLQVKEVAKQANCSENSQDSPDDIVEQSDTCDMVTQQLNPIKPFAATGVRNILAQLKSLQVKGVAKQANSSKNRQGSPEDIVEQSDTFDMITQQLNPTKPLAACVKNILVPLKSFQVKESAVPAEQASSSHNSHYSAHNTVEQQLRSDAFDTIAQQPKPKQPTAPEGKSSVLAECKFQQVKEHTPAFTNRRQKANQNLPNSMKLKNFLKSQELSFMSEPCQAQQPRHGRYMNKGHMPARSNANVGHMPAQPQRTQWCHKRQYSRKQNSELGKLNIIVNSLAQQKHPATVRFATEVPKVSFAAQKKPVDEPSALMNSNKLDYNEMPQPTPAPYKACQPTKANASKPQQQQPFTDTDLDDSENLLLAHSNVPVKPLASIAEAPLSRCVQTAMRDLNFVTLQNTQRYAWPHLLLGNSLVLVNRCSSGRTWCYLPTLCSSVMRNILLGSGGPDQEHLLGPLAILLTDSVASAHTLAKHCSLLMENLSTELVKVLDSHAHALAHVNMVMLNACGILVTTPAHLTLLLQQHQNGLHLFDAYRLQHIIIDDYDRIKSMTPGLLDEVTQSLIKMRLWRLQLVVIAQQWHAVFKKLLKRFAYNPLLLFGDFLEASIYGGMNMEVDVRPSAQKTQQLLEYLKGRQQQSERTLVLCQRESELALLQNALQTAGRRCVGAEQAANQQTTDILLLTDAMLEQPQLRIRNIRLLVHFSLPGSWSAFSNRFRAVVDNIDNYFGSTRSEQRIVCLVMMDEGNACELARLVSFMQSHDIVVDQHIVQLAKHYKLQTDLNQPMCPVILGGAECTQQQCPNRHRFISEDLPRESRPEQQPGTAVRGKLFKVYSPVHLAIRPTSYKAANSTQWEPLPNTANTSKLTISLNLHMGVKSNRRIHSPVKAHDVCVVLQGQAYKRVRVLTTPTLSTANTEIAVQLVDNGTDVFLVRASELLQCNEQFRQLPPLAIDVRLPGLAPAGNEPTWKREACNWANYALTDLTERQYLQMDIEFSTRASVYVRNMTVVQKCDNMGTYVVVLNVERDLLRLDYGQENKQYAKKLRDMYDDVLTVEVPLETPSQNQRSVVGWTEQPEQTAEPQADIAAWSNGENTFFKKTVDKLMVLVHKYWSFGNKVEVEAETVKETDAETGVETDVEADAETNAGTDVATDVKTDAEFHVQSDPESDVDTDDCEHELPDNPSIDYNDTKSHAVAVPEKSGTQGPFEFINTLISELDNGDKVAAQKFIKSLVTYGDDESPPAVKLEPKKPDPPEAVLTPANQLTSAMQCISIADGCVRAKVKWYQTYSHIELTIEQKWPHYELLLHKNTLVYQVMGSTPPQRCIFNLLGEVSIVSERQSGFYLYVKLLKRLIIWWPALLKSVDDQSYTNWLTYDTDREKESDLSMEYEAWNANERQQYENRDGDDNAEQSCSDEECSASSYGLCDDF